MNLVMDFCGGLHVVRVHVILAILLGIALFALPSSPPPGGDPPRTPPSTPDTSHPVIFEGRRLFSIRTSSAPAIAEKQVQDTQDHLLMMAQDPFLDQERLTTETTNFGIKILYRRELLLVVTELDARAEERSLEELARARVWTILDAALKYREAHFKKQSGFHLALFAFATLFLVVAFAGLYKFLNWLEEFELRKHRANS